MPIQFFHAFTRGVKAWHAEHRNISPLPELSEWTLHDLPLYFLNPHTSTEGGFPVIAETTRNHTFSKEISQVMLEAMVSAPDFCCKNCQRVISAMRGNPPLKFGIKQSKIG